MLKFLLKRKIIVGLFITLIFAFGLYGITNLDKELYPEIDFNQTMVMIETEEMPAEDVEKFITIPIEQALDGIDGIKKYQSSSTETNSTILIEVENKNPGTITKEIESEVNNLKGDLYGMKDSSVIQATTSADYEMVFDISGANGAEMKDYALNVIEPRLEALSEVRDVRISGLEENEIQIIPKSKQLEKYQLNEEDIINAIEQTNQSVTLGTLENEAEEPGIRWNTSFQQVKDIKNVPITTNEDIITLSDIATIKEEKQNQIASAWKNGKSNFLLVEIGRVKDVSQIDMADAVRTEIQKIKDEVESPAKINEIVAQADYVDEAIGGVTDNIIIGGIIAIIVLLLFLRNIRATVIIGLSIPASILLTILTMTLLDYSFNLLSLIGLGLGIGMMVDASIVVLESIFRKKEMGFSNINAVLTGTKEVVGAVLSSMLTTIVVFIPIVLLDEEVGKMVIVLTVVIAVTLISSVIVSFTLIPVLSERFMKVNLPKKNRYRLTDKYGSILNWLTKKKRRRIGIISLFLIIFASSFVLLTKIPLSFMPDILNRYAEVFVELEPGTTHKERADIAVAMNEELSVVRDVETNIILDNTDMLFAIINMTSEEDKTLEQEEINEQIFKNLNGLKDEYPISNVGSAMEGITNPPIEMLITGENLDTLQATGEKFAMELEKMDNITSANLQIGEQEKQYVIDIDNKRLKDDHVSQSYLLMSLSQLFSDRPIGELAREGNTTPIIFKNQFSINDKQALLKQKIGTQNGEKKLSEYISLKETTSPSQIDRDNGERYISVTADYEGNNLGKIHTDINQLIKDMDIEKGYSVDLAGDLQEQQDAAKDLIIIFIISLFLVFVVMAIQFNSIKHPIIILFIIPLTLTGVLIGLFVTQKELNILSAIGVIMLIGIVINNGILLIDRTRQLRDQGQDAYQAIIHSGKERIRPILMTTLTTVGGMLPLAFATGNSSDYQSPLAIVIISGLLFSTLITLFLIPAIYLVFEDMHGFIGRKFRRKKHLNQDSQAKRTS